MNEMKLNSSVYRWFRHETFCFLTSRHIQPCLGYGSMCCVSCKVCYNTNIIGCTCQPSYVKSYIKGSYLFPNVQYLLLLIIIPLGCQLLMCS